MPSVQFETDWSCLICLQNDLPFISDTTMIHDRLKVIYGARNVRKKCLTIYIKFLQDNLESSASESSASGLINKACYSFSSTRFKRKHTSVSLAWEE